MKRTPLLVIIACFLLTTAALAPVAFRFGKAQGAPTLPPLSQSETIFADIPGANRDTNTDCGLLGRNGSIHRPNIIVDCHPVGGAETFQVAVAAPGPRREARTIFDGPVDRRQAPLENAVLATVAGRGAATAGGASDNPVLLAIAPEPADDLGGGSIFSGPGPTIPGGGGVPSRLIPDIAANTPPSGGGNEDGGGDGGQPEGPPTTNTPDPEDDPLPPVFEIPDGNPDPDDNPDLVTPVPAAAPLLLTGLLGLFAARRRKQRPASRS